MNWLWATAVKGAVKQSWTKFKPDNFILHIVLIMRVIICKRALNIGDRQGVVGGNGDNCT